MMRWLIDECVGRSIQRHLQQRGHDVETVSDVRPGVADPFVLRYCQDNDRLLLTSDKDFGDLVFRHRLSATGVVLLRMPPGSLQTTVLRLDAAIETFGERLRDRVTIIGPEGLRSRPIS